MAPVLEPELDEVLAPELLEPVLVAEPLDVVQPPEVEAELVLCEVVAEEEYAEFADAVPVPDEELAPLDDEPMLVAELATEPDAVSEAVVQEADVAVLDDAVAELEGADETEV